MKQSAPTLGVRLDAAVKCPSVMPDYGQNSSYFRDIRQKKNRKIYMGCLREMTSNNGGPFVPAI